MTHIGEQAFQACSGLENITIPISLTSIGNSVFSDCSSLANIAIPQSVTSIGSNAFRNCTNIKMLVIPNGLSVIGNHAFEGCSNLASITIPNSVKTIGEYAFSNCLGLYSVTSLITVPYKLNESVFQCTGDYDADVMYSIAKLYVPIGRSSVYAATTGWNKFNSIAEVDTKFKLTYILDGEVYKTYDIQAAEVITPEPDPYKTGYIFSGWSEIPYLMPAEDVIVTGSFTADPDYVGIDTVMKSEAVPAIYFSADGRRVDSKQKGLNIIKMNDGTVRKLFIK